MSHRMCVCALNMMSHCMFILTCLGPCYRQTHGTTPMKQRIPDLRSPEHKMDAAKRSMLCAAYVEYVCVCVLIVIIRIS